MADAADKLEAAAEERREAEEEAGLYSREEDEKKIPVQYRAFSAWA